VNTIINFINQASMFIIICRLHHQFEQPNYYSTNLYECKLMIIIMMFHHW